MNKFLIFRTDRIGDFLISAILIRCIKINDPKSHITVIASKKNYLYIKGFTYIDDVIKLENNFLNKIQLILKLNQVFFKNIIIHDNKKRSKFISLFLKSNNKIFLDNSLKFSHIQLIKIILKKLNFSYFDDSLNTLSHKIKTSSKIEDIIQLHFDEKWIYNSYISQYINIEPNKTELIEFLVLIMKKTKKKLIITSGKHKPKVLEDINLAIARLNIEIYNDLSFSELEKITLRSKILISCHGAISHIASANKIRQIDIIDKSYNYNVWTEHFRNYDYLYRSNFNKLSKKIIDKL